MKRFTLAIGTMALGLATGVGTAYAQAPAQRPTIPRQTVSPVPAPPAARPVYPEPNPALARPNYSLYGGPSESEYPPRRGTTGPSFSPIYKIYGVPDQITTADKAREARRNSAVEFGMFRNQFPGSTQFWMDYDRTRLAKVRYSMDEPMFHSIHPDYEWGDGGYLYNTGTFVGGPHWSGSDARVMVHPPKSAPTTRMPHVVQVSPDPVRENMTPSSPTAPARPAAPMVASE